MTYYRLNKDRDVFLTKIETFPEYEITDISSQYLSLRDYYNDSHYYYYSPDQPLSRTTSSIKFLKVNITSSYGRVINQLQNYYGEYWSNYESLSNFTGNINIVDIPKSFFGKEIVRNKFVFTQTLNDSSNIKRRRVFWDDGRGSLYSNCYFNLGCFNVICFDGVNDYIVGTAPVITGSFTIVCWMKLNSINGAGYSHVALAGGGYDSGFDTVVFGVFAESGSVGNATSIYDGWPPHKEQWAPDWPSQIYVSPYWPTWEKGWQPQWFTSPPKTSDPLLYFGGGNSIVTPLSTQEISLNQWYRAVMVYDHLSNKVTFYVNGMQRGERTVGSMSIDAGKMVIGAYNNLPSVQHPFPGCLYDLRIYSFAWSVVEVLDDYDYSNSTVNYDLLARHWWLDEIFEDSTVFEEIDSTYDTLVGATTSLILEPPPLCLHSCSILSCGQKVGNIFYSEGIAFVTNSEIVEYETPAFSYITYELSFSGSNNIYVENIFCHVKDHEANFSNNPSAYTLAENNEKIKICSSSEDKTWISGIGLYDKEYRLVGAAKLASPIRKLPNDKLLFKLRIDI